MSNLVAENGTGLQQFLFGCLKNYCCKEYFQSVSNRSVLNIIEDEFSVSHDKFWRAYPKPKFFFCFRTLRCSAANCAKWRETLIQRRMSAWKRPSRKRRYQIINHVTLMLSFISMSYYCRRPETIEMNRDIGTKCVEKTLMLKVEIFCLGD